MKSGYNPSRRNRNLGTSKQGHGQANTFCVPSLCHDERIWWENLGQHTVLCRQVKSREITFLVEQLREDCIHACTVDDICHILSLVPTVDWELLNTFVLRQSTRKQWIVSPTWGRLAYSAEFGQPGRKPRHGGPAVLLEAINPAASWAWSKHLSPGASSEVKRLKSDGHLVVDKGRFLLFQSTPESVRATQLFRTLLHEIGHWVDWLEKVVRPAHADPDNYDALSERFFARPKQERERFAHRYADSLRKRLVAEGHLPFPAMGHHAVHEAEALLTTESTNRSPS